MTETVGWVALLALGAFHGVNPAMGWLFAVALGLQEQDRRAVWRALLPLGVGHALAVAVAVAIAAAVGLVVPLAYLRWIVAGLLLGMGLFRSVRHRHPRYGGMRVSGVDLAVWSFLMASAHGAGLMVVPLVMDARYPTEQQLPASSNEPGPITAAAHGGKHGQHASMAMVGSGAGGHPGGVGATAVHTVGYLLITGLVALVVFEKLGLGVLRSLWVNVDLVWAASLVMTGILTPFM